MGNVIAVWSAAAGTAAAVLQFAQFQAQMAARRRRNRKAAVTGVIVTDAYSGAVLASGREAP